MPTASRAKAAPVIPQFSSGSSSSSASNKNTISEVSEVRQLDRHGYYVTLGLLPGASAEAIRSAYVAIRTCS